MFVYNLSLKKMDNAMQDIVLFLQHHLLLTSLFGGILLLLFIVEFIKLQRNANKVSPAQAVQLMNRDKASVIDLRDKEAFAAGHIVNSTSLPYAELSVKLKKIQKFKSQPVVVVCNVGTDSARAATLLIQQGFQVHILSGGISAWRNAGMPLVKG
jgi:rhodanese-related sulfurtransferase